MRLFFIFLSLVAVLGVLLYSEYLWRKKKLNGEQLRKFVHVLVGIFVAFWPLFMSWRTIQLISIAFLVVIFLSRRYKLFHALLSVKRKSYGDIAFAVGIGLSATLTESSTIFAVAILHMAVADGLAALIGAKFGKNWRYKVFGQEKTVVGSMAFWLISLFILGIGLLFTSTGSSFDSYTLALIVVPPALTLVENLINHGFDNIAIPLACVLLLGAI